MPPRGGRARRRWGCACRPRCVCGLGCTGRSRRRPGPGRLLWSRSARGRAARLGARGAGVPQPRWHTDDPFRSPRPPRSRCLRRSILAIAPVERKKSTDRWRSGRLWWCWRAANHRGRTVDRWSRPFMMTARLARGFCSESRAGARSWSEATERAEGAWPCTRCSSSSSYSFSFRLCSLGSHAAGDPGSTVAYPRSSSPASADRNPPTSVSPLTARDGTVWGPCPGQPVSRDVSSWVGNAMVRVRRRVASTSRGAGTHSWLVVDDSTFPDGTFERLDARPRHGARFFARRCAGGSVSLPAAWRCDGAAGRCG